MSRGGYRVGAGRPRSRIVITQESELGQTLDLVTELWNTRQLVNPDAETFTAYNVVQKLVADEVRRLYRDLRHATEEVLNGRQDHE